MKAKSTIRCVQNPDIYSAIQTKPRLSPLQHSIGKCLLAVALLPVWMAGHSAQAVDATWTGGASTVNFADLANWSGGAPSSNNLIFGSTSGATTLTNDLAAGTTLYNITFNSGSPAYTFTGNAITLGGAITVNSGNVQTINNDLTITASRSLSAASGTIVLNGNISGSGGALGLTGVATSVILGGSNSFTGGVTTGDGRFLSITNRNALGSGTLNLNASTFDNLSNGDLVLDNVLNTSTSNTTIFKNSTGSVTFSNSVYVRNRVANWNVTQNTLTFAGKVYAMFAETTGTYTKLGAGTLYLKDVIDTSGNSSAVLMRVQEGTLKLGNTASLGSAATTVVQLGFNSVTSTLDLATDTSVSAYNITTPNLSPGVAQFISNRATAGAGITHTLGTLSMGSSAVGATLNFLAGDNVTSGQASIAFGAAYAGNSGNIYLNPTTATVSLASLTGTAGTTTSITTVWLDGTSEGKITGAIADATGGTKIAITKSNTSTWELTGINTYSGNTKINQGTLRAGLGSLSANSLILLNGGVLESSGVFNREAGGIPGKLGWYTNGAGGGFSAYGAKLTVDLAATTELQWGSVIYGTLMFGSATSNAEVEFKDGLNLNGADRTIDVAAGTGGDFTTLSGGIRTATGTAGLIKTGSGRLVLAGANTYNGATMINGGQLDVNTSLAASSNVVVSSGAALGGSGTVNGSAAVTSGSVKGIGLKIAGATTFEGASHVSGNNEFAGGFTAVSGTLTLGGVVKGAAMVNNTATLVNGGTLTGAVNVNGTFAGGGTVDGNFTVNNGGKLALLLNGTVVSEQLIVDGGSSLITLGDTSILSLSFAQALQGNEVFTLIANHGDGVFSGKFGSVMIDGQTFNLNGTDSFTYNNFTYGFSYTGNVDGGTLGNDLVLVVVPEPATWAMLLGGLGAMGLVQRMRRNLRA